MVQPAKEVAPVARDAAAEARQLAPTLVQQAGNAAAVQEKGLAPLTPAEGQRQEFSPSIDTIDLSAATAALDRQQASIDQALPGVDAKDPGASHEASKATIAALDAALTNQAAGDKASLIANSFDAVAKVTSTTLKSHDPAKLTEVFNGLAGVAEKAGSDFVSTVADAMIENLGKAGAGGLPAFEKGVMEAMKTGNSLLAASLTKQLGQSKEANLRELGARLSGAPTTDG